MGIYIPKAKLPSSCWKCELSKYVENCPCAIGINSASNWKAERHPNCPLSEIKEPHGKLVDVNVVDDLIQDCIEESFSTLSDAFEAGLNRARDCMYEAPVIIESEYN